MVSISEGMVYDVPGLIPRKSLLINQDSEKLNSSDSRMSIVKLDLVLLWELVPVGVVSLESGDQISNSG